ncbi:hypothetical protein PQ478_08735 [Alkalihalophilus pseudofirmus]|uniref:hypothetical protein n=1 Tax=Alkalihalophilus pseudofirmus TaxID=79885 RepID=UPI00259B1A25|nr:hypothetical protein [Alkalihalophilus pseudofirmus]WEG18555.1 hypothetical protein PQ478_08735 [Alkalihalophilus pseudofirmus]
MRQSNNNYSDLILIFDKYNLSTAAVANMIYESYDRFEKDLPYDKHREFENDLIPLMGRQGG